MKRYGTSWPRASASSRASSTTTPPLGGSPPLLRNWTRTAGTRGNHAFYLSIPPKAFEQVCRQLSKHGLAQAEGEKWRRVVIEKPFGHDLESARQLNDIVESVFPQDAVFRIDHYLGKETVQNILALRFVNQLFEPLWNAKYVDHVQITMAEDIGTGGRAGYYDGVGAARDVIQNHLLQLLALTAMEEPISFNADDLRAEKEKVLAAVRLPEDLSTHSARGQFAGGWQGGEEVQGYLEEDGIPADSTTETYAGDPGGHQHPALDRGAVLPARRQAARTPCHRNRGGVQAGTEPALPRPRRRRLRPERRGDPGPARRGRHDPVWRPRSPAPRWRSATSRWTSATARLHRIQPRSLRAADPGRAPGRAAAVSPPPGGGAVLEHPGPVREVLGLPARPARAVRARQLGPGLC